MSQKSSQSQKPTKKVGKLVKKLDLGAPAEKPATKVPVKAVAEAKVPIVVKKGGAGNSTGWRIRTQRAANGDVKYHVVLHNGRKVAGVARNSVLIFNTNPDHPTYLSALAPHCKSEDVTTNSEGSRFRGVDMEAFVKAVGCDIAVDDIPKFTPRLSRRKPAEVTEKVATAPAKPHKVTAAK